MALIFLLSTFIPIVMKNIQYAVLGRWSFLFVSLGMFVAVTKYRAFNIRTAIHYTVYWVLVSVAVFAPLWAIVFFLTPTLNQLFQADFGVNGLFGMLFVSSLAVFFHFQWLQPKLNQRFFRRKFQLKEHALTFSETISQITDTPTLIAHIQRTFTELLYATEVQVLIGERESHLPEGNNDTPNIPLWINQKRIGTICVGEKKTLKAYDKEELVFMHKISRHTAIFLNNVILFDTLKAKNTELLMLQDTLLESERQKATMSQIQIHTEELARGIIHEVKNTHFAIGNFVSLILKRQINNSAEIDTILSVIGEQSAKLLLFSKNYLHQELVKSQLDTLRLDPVNLKELITAAIKSNYFFVQTHALSLQISITPTDTIVADSDKLHLVISNLINNAAKYQKENTLHIEGVPKDDRYTLTFTSQKTQLALERPENTTGLGLRISRYIVETHGGTLSVSDDPTAFVVVVSLPKNPS